MALRFWLGGYTEHICDAPLLESIISLQNFLVQPVRVGYSGYWVCNALIIEKKKAKWVSYECCIQQHVSIMINAHRYISPNITFILQNICCLQLLDNLKWSELQQNTLYSTVATGLQPSAARLPDYPRRWQLQLKSLQLLTSLKEHCTHYGFWVSAIQHCKGTP